MGISIKYGGLLTTVQDAGRKGYQTSGFGVSGVMDQRSYQIANMLLSNDPEEAVLEATVMGPEILFLEHNLFAVTGGDFAPSLDGKPIDNYAVYLGQKGSVLKLSFAKEGARAYIAFAGGLDIPMVMGSRSTNLKCRLGGFHGRKLEAGDEIAFRAPVTELPNMYKRYEKIREFSEREITLRIVPGPQDDYFSEEGMHTFFNSAYKVGQESDRMGYRLEGEAIAAKKGVDIISDGIAFGSIQVPASGMPIIMMADRQTTGGYAKIGTVITTDLPKLAQSMPGTVIHFEPVTVEEAQRLRRKEVRRLKHLKHCVS